MLECLKILIGEIIKITKKRKEIGNMIPLRVCHFGPAGACKAALAPWSSKRIKNM
jgi:hypothetical protein